METNGQKLPCGNDFLGALAIRGLAHIDAGEKDAMRQLIIGKHQWSETEQRAILEYCDERCCRSDCVAPRDGAHD